MAPLFHLWSTTEFTPWPHMPWTAPRQSLGPEKLLVQTHLCGIWDSSNGRLWAQGLLTSLVFTLNFLAAWNSFYPILDPSPYRSIGVRHTLQSEISSCLLLIRLIFSWQSINLLYIVMVNFMYQFYWAKGYPDSWQNTISGSVCEGISRRG